jgi:hypothetical protein
LAKSKHQDRLELLCPWGFERSDLEMRSEDNSENGLLEMHHVRNYEEFSFIDSSHQCCNENEDLRGSGC